LVQSEIMNSLYNMADEVISFVPTLVAIILLIIVGKILGSIIGKIGAKILDKIGLDDLIDKTVIGGMIKKANMSTVGFFEAIIRWFIYIIFAVIIIDLLQIQAVADFITMIILYIPLIISALVVLIIGLLIVDFISDLVKTILVATGVDEKVEKTSIGTSIKAGGASVSGIIAGLVRIFGYLIFLTAVADILQLTMITQLLIDITEYLPRLLTGVLILVIGILSIDIVMDYLAGTVKGMNVEGYDAYRHKHPLPLLRAAGMGNCGCSCLQIWSQRRDCCVCKRKEVISSFHFYKKRPSFRSVKG